MATTSNGRTLDPLSDRDERSRRRAQTVVADRHHGADRDEPPRRKPWLPLAGLRLAPTMTDHEEHILYLMIVFDDRTRSRPQSAAMGSRTDGRREALAGKPIGEVTGDRPAVVTGPVTAALQPNTCPLGAF
jgi:hypothetical protein